MSALQARMAYNVHKCAAGPRSHHCATCKRLYDARLA
jgi:hypothetical protein